VSMSSRLIADLEAAGAFAGVLERCATPAKDIIISVTDVRHVRWARNLLFNLDSFGHRHTLVIGGSTASCSLLASHGDPRPLPCACAYSSHLRSHLGLRKWRISQSHVYLLWWQRWHYAALAVSMSYRVLALDTDLSLRTDPYPILWASPLSDHSIIVGLDSESDGKENYYTFPSINVGFVYCTGKRGGASAWVLGEISRRAAQLLDTPMPSGMAPQMRLWEQDLFRDAVESAAFGNLSFRHSLRHISSSGSAARKASAAAARELRWRHALSTTLVPSTLVAEPRRLCWLPLHRPPDAGGVPTADAANASSERLAGLPQWFFSQYIVMPHGHPRYGAWARQPSPVVVGHTVGVRIKLWIMRALGWWQYDAEARAATWPRDAADARWGGMAVVQVASGPGGATEQAMQRPRRVFSAHSRLLVMRGHHELRWRSLKSTDGVPAVMARWILIALALGRRPVIPLVPCMLSSRNGLPLGMYENLIPLRNHSLCDRAALEPHATIAAEASVGWSAGWSATVDSTEVTRSVEAAHGPCCCVWVPPAPACIDAVGTGANGLRGELLLTETDLGRLLSEARAERRAKVKVVSLTQLGSGSGAGAPNVSLLADLRRLGRSRARVLVLDVAHGPPLHLLGNLEELQAAAAAMAASDKFVRQGVDASYAPNCLSSLHSSFVLPALLDNWRAKKARAGSALGASTTWLANSRDGYCERTDGPGNCQHGGKGSHKLSPADLADYETAASACLRYCMLCARRCRYISLSLVHADCSWFYECNLRQLRKDVAGFISGVVPVGSQSPVSFRSG